MVAHIPAQQPRIRVGRTGRPRVSSEEGEFDAILVQTLHGDKFAKTDGALDREEIIGLRTALREAAKRQTRLHPEWLDYPEDSLKVTMLVTDPAVDQDDPAATIAQGGAKGELAWLDKIPEDGRFDVWFQMHKPKPVGPRARKRRRGVDGPGGHLLLRLAGGFPKWGGPPSGFLSKVGRRWTRHMTAVPMLMPTLAASSRTLSDKRKSFSTPIPNGQNDWAVSRPSSSTRKTRSIATDQPRASVHQRAANRYRPVNRIIDARMMHVDALLMSSRSPSRKPPPPMRSHLQMPSNSLLPLSNSQCITDSEGSGGVWVPWSALA
jgi:hypothetical protein